MPHVGSSSAEDLASSDEIKVFKDEGEDEKRASADLTDLKSSLISDGDQVIFGVYYSRATLQCLGVHFWNLSPILPTPTPRLFGSHSFLTG